jgi:Tfp pilus assembly protein PilN
MFKWLLIGALVLSIAFCAWRDFEGQQMLKATRADIAGANGELKPLRQIADEVSAFETQKDALQKRIDLINQLKQNQKGPTAALATLSTLDASSIDSVAVLGNSQLVVNRR